MTAITSETHDNHMVRSNVARLAVAQALTGANTAVIFATGSIVGAAIAPNMSLATLPLIIIAYGVSSNTLFRGLGLAFLIGGLAWLGALFALWRASKAVSRERLLGMGAS